MSTTDSLRDIDAYQIWTDEGLRCYSTVFMAIAATIPDRVGPYHPVALLGQGGMGVVYRAEHVRRPGRYVALKVIRESPELDTDDARRRFRREASLLEGLRHPNIVSILDVGLDGLCQYFAMELLEGHPLSVYVGSPYHTIAPLLVQVCQGLNYLASRSIVHRDLSPSNILIVDEHDLRVVKILDFGIAKDVESKDTLHDFTRTGLIMGKPSYWSPELLGSLGSSRLIDWRSDVYALGVIFFQLFSGRLPFQCDTPYEYALAHLSQPPPVLEAPPARPPLPTALAAVVSRMLAKSRDERPAYPEIIDVLTQHAEWPTSITAVDAPPADGVGTVSIAPTPVVSVPRAPIVTRPVSRISIPRAVQTLSRKKAPVAIFATILALGLLAFLLGRRQRSTVSSAPSATTESVPRGPTSETATRGSAFLVGILHLDAVPWARVETIVNESTGGAIPVAADLTTPVSLEVPPGRYRISMVCGIHEQRKAVVVDVTAGGVTSINESFGEPRDLLVLLE